MLLTRVEYEPFLDPKTSNTCKGRFSQRPLLDTTFPSYLQVILYMYGKESPRGGTKRGRASKSRLENMHYQYPSLTLCSRYLREPQSEEQAVPVEQPLRDPPTDGPEQSGLEDGEPRRSVPFAAGRAGHPLSPFLRAGQDLPEDQTIPVVAQGRCQHTKGLG